MNKSDVIDKYDKFFSSINELNCNSRLRHFYKPDVKIPVEYSDDYFTPSEVNTISYSEIVAGTILKYEHLFDRVDSVKRKLDYEVDRSQYVADCKIMEAIEMAADTSTSARKRGNINSERIVTMRLANHSRKYGFELGDWGRIFDYEFPLNSVRSDKLGKIDLLSYNDANDVLYLVEAKRPHESSSESLLRAVLEIQTYYQVLKDSFADPTSYLRHRLKKIMQIDCNRKIEVRKAILLIWPMGLSSQYGKDNCFFADTQYMCKTLNGNIHELLKRWKIDVLRISEVKEYQPDKCSGEFSIIR